MPGSEDSRPDTDFGWVTDLPSYSGQLPVQASSLLPRFSLFSLFRSKPHLPDEEQLEPLLLLAHSPIAPTAKEAVKALTCLADYVALLKTSCSAADAEDAEQWVLKAMEGYLAAVSVICNATFAEGATASDKASLSATVPRSLRGLFTIYNHFVGSSRRSVTSWLDTIDCNLLASPYPAADTSRHLVPLFEQTRYIISSLQHAARATSTKSPVAPSEATVRRWEDLAGTRMDWLRLYSDHVRGLSGLSITVEEADQYSFGKRRKKMPTKAEVKSAEKRRAERSMRIAIEADLLRCDLAISMATARIGEIKRRAKAQYSVPAPEEDGGEDVKPVISRKRRALTDESDCEIMVHDMAEHSPEPSPVPVGAKHWEEEVEQVLLQTLRRCKDLIDEKHAEVLTGKIDRSQWLHSEQDSSKTPSPSKRSPVKAQPVGQRGNSGETSDSDSSSGNNSDDESDEEDLLHPCPLRTLFRLHDRYEEQRLAVWLSLPTNDRGKMGSYMRGAGERVGQAWDALGLRLLLDYDSGTLEAYGLSLDKHDKWVELASRQDAKKIRKKGRKSGTVEVVISPKRRVRDEE